MDYLQRPKYHFKPEKGWINDPNGLVFFKDWYHIFYQHCPDFEVPWKQPVVWGHARTKNFIDWEELPVAISPTEAYESGGCWSGTAIVKDGVLYLCYSSVVNNGDDNPKWLQTVSIAYSEDGVNFKKYGNNPVIKLPPADGSRENFRDPALCRVGDGYVCVLATGHEESKTARLLLYKSDDLLNWEYDGITAEWENGICAECPSLVKTDNGYILSASVIPTDWKHFFSLFYGKFENGKFKAEHSARPQKGPDQYAGQLFSDESGRNILISWIPGWDYASFAEKDIGCMSIPCEVCFENGKCRIYPVEEVRHLLKDSDEAVKITDGGFVINRSGREPIIYTGEITDIKIFRDGYIAEVFVNGGEAVYTAVL